jgi:hypothetical protein
MPKFSPDFLRPIWERALASEIGIAIETNDPTALRHNLSTAKNQFPDSELFDDVMTFCPKGLSEVWLVRKSAELPDA